MAEGSDLSTFKQWAILIGTAFGAALTGGFTVNAADSVQNSEIVHNAKDIEILQKEERENLKVVVKIEGRLDTVEGDVSEIKGSLKALDLKIDKLLMKEGIE